MKSKLIFTMVVWSHLLFLKIFADKKIPLFLFLLCPTALYLRCWLVDVLSNEKCSSIHGIKQRLEERYIESRTSEGIREVDMETSQMFEFLFKPPVCPDLVYWIKLVSNRAMFCWHSQPIQVTESMKVPSISNLKACDALLWNPVVTL